MVAHDWGGGIGMGAAVETPERFSRFVLMNTAAFRAAMPLVDPCLPHSRCWAAGGAGAEPLRPRGHADGRCQARADDARGAWPARPPTTRGATAWRCCGSCSTSLCGRAHPSYPTLVKIEEGLPQFRASPVLLDLGHGRMVLHAGVPDRFLDFFPEAEVHPLADAGHYVVEDAYETIVPLLEDFLRRYA